jgi:hypothetical protein
VDGSMEPFPLMQPLLPYIKEVISNKFPTFNKVSKTHTIIQWYNPPYPPNARLRKMVIDPRLLLRHFSKSHEKKHKIQNHELLGFLNRSIQTMHLTPPFSLKFYELS